MDAVPPAPPTPVYTYAASDSRPRSAEEEKLCEKGSTFDWTYMLAPVLTAAGAVALDTQVFKFAPGVVWGYVGGGLVGIGWGWTIGSIYPAMPRCSPSWVGGPPIEGEVRTEWPIAFGFALASAITAPLWAGTEYGAIPPPISDTARFVRAGVAAVGGFTGALLPYVLPPAPLRVARELAKIRAGTTPDAKGAFVGYVVRF